MLTLTWLSRSMTMSINPVKLKREGGGYKLLTVNVLWYQPEEIYGLWFRNLSSKALRMFYSRVY